MGLLEVGLQVCAQISRLSMGLLEVGVPWMTRLSMGLLEVGLLVCAQDD